MTGVAQGPSVRRAELFGLALTLMRNVRRLRLCYASGTRKKALNVREGMKRNDVGHHGACGVADGGSEAKMTERRFCA